MLHVNKQINIRIMDIKDFLIISLFILCGCQPEQTKWPESRAVQRSTPGQVVFEALANNVARQGACGPERTSLLQKKKRVFISKFDALLNTFSGGDQEENIRLLTAYLKNNESKDKILKTASLIEKYATNITYFIKNFKEVLSADDRAVERVILNLIHSKDFDKLLADLAERAGPKLEIVPLVSQIETLIDKNFVHMSIHDFAQKILKLFEDSSELHKIGKKVLALTQKLSDPAVKDALLELKNILSKVFPDLSFDNIETWREQVKTLPKPGDFGDWVAKYLLSSPNLSPTVVKGIVHFAAYTTSYVPAFLPDLVDRLTADENNFKILRRNIHILYKAGVIDDILDLIAEFKKFKQLTQTDIDVILDLISDPDKTKLLPETEYFIKLKYVISQAKKLFPADQSILEAPAVVVAQVILQVLATNNQNECRPPTEKTDLSLTIRGWVNSLVAFMKDSERGLIYILSIIRYNL